MSNLHPKAKGAGVGGALAVVILAIASRLHVEVTATEAGALATLLATALSYAVGSAD